MAPRRPPSPFAFNFPRLRPGVKVLLVATAVASIGLSALLAWWPGGPGEAAAQALLLVPATIWRGHLWKLFTFSFPILDPLTLLFTGLWLWMMGSDLEEQWGRRRLLLHYFASTALGALAAGLLGLLVPRIGATMYSGGWTTVMPVLMGFAMAMPDRQFAFFLVPPFQARLLVPITTGVMLLVALMTGSVVTLVVPFFTQLAAVALAASRFPLPRPGKLWLRVRVWWFERQMRGRKLRVVPGLPKDEELPKPRSGSRGSDHYLH